MFSEELRILDRNTVMYMIDEMQEEIDRQSKQLDQKDEVIARQGQIIEELKKKLKDSEMNV